MKKKSRIQFFIDILRQRKKFDELKCDLFELYLSLNAKSNYPMQSPDQLHGTAVFDPNAVPSEIKYIFPNINFLEFNEHNLSIADNYFIWGTHYYTNKFKIARAASYYNKPIYTFEAGFLYGADTFANDKCDEKYRTCISYIYDSVVPYYDARYQSNMEAMLNDKSLLISEEQKKRARNCINKIVENHITKYNHQPIYTPKIGRDGVKKVLVVDQSYGDMSILKGRGSDFTFEKMLECAVKENPDADIIVKTHPDTMTGNRGGYYTGLKSNKNIYTQTDPINPISLINYADKVYVCTTQFGFEALMCGKEVHTFGLPFYAGWGLTKDFLKCDRRTNKRSLEDVFYIAYIMYSHYINPVTKQKCEIEEAIDYLINLRDEYNKYKKSK